MATEAKIPHFKGPLFYDENDKDYFKGREKETKKLLYVVEHSDFSVCYAVSGEGKSSLINAGLCPELRKQGFLPIHIRNITEAEDGHFDEFVGKVIDKSTEEAKLSWQENVLESEIEDLATEPQSDSANLYNTVWWKLRNHEFRRASFDTVTPVLIFDQFEEVFKTDKGLGWINAFFSWLEQLYRDENPLAGRYSGKLQKKFKALFSLRSEYVCELDYWSMDKYFIPSLKNNRFFLKPLTKNGAFEVVKQLDGQNENLSHAVVKYAKAERIGKWEDSTKASDLPCVSALVLSLILTGLSEKDQSEREAIVEEYGQQEENNKKNGIFDSLLRQTYEEALKECGYENNRRVRDFIDNLEDVLIDSNGNRKHATKEDLEESPSSFDKKVMQKTLQTFQDKRIVNEVNGNFEISHDSLCSVIYRIRDKRHRSKKAELKRSILRKDSRIDFFVQLPIYIIIIFDVFFLQNAVMNEASTLFRKCGFYTEEDYIGIECFSFLKYPIVHLIGNLLMILWTFLVANIIVLYAKNIRVNRFKIYSFFTLVFSLALSYWHIKYYAPYHDVLKFNEYYVKLCWIVIYVFLVGMPSVFLAFSFAYRANRDNKVSWRYMLTMQALFSSKLARWYMVLLLFVCLCLCVFPLYKRSVSSGESIVFVALIGIFIKSVFERSTRWKKRLVSYLPILFLCIGLWATDGEFIAKIKPFSYLLNKSVAVFFLTLFLIYAVGEYFACRRFSNLRKNSFLRIYMKTIIITTFASFIYTGVAPWKSNELLFPTHESVSKWKFYITRIDSLYCVKLYNGVTLFPYIGDSLISNNNIIVKGSIENIVASKMDSLFMSHSDSIKTNAFTLYQNRIPVELSVRPYFIYAFSQGGLSYQDPEEKRIHSLASSTYLEILNSIFLRVRSGEKMSSKKIGHAKELRNTLKGHSDSLYKKLSPKYRKQKSSVPLDSLMLYFETVVKELSLVAMEDMLDANDLYSASYTLYVFENSFFHPVMKKEQWKSNTTMNLQYNFSIISPNNSNKDDYGFDYQAIYDLDGLSRYQIYHWQQLWKMLYAYIRQHVQTDWGWEYEKVTEDINALLQIELKPKGEGKKTRGEMPHPLYLVKDTLSFPERHSEMKKELITYSNEISTLTDSTMYESFGRETVREMITILMICSFNQEAYESVKEIQEKDKKEMEDTYMKLFNLLDLIQEFNKEINKRNIKK